MSDLYLGATVISILGGLLATASGWLASKSSDATNVDPRYAQEWGWIPGLRHAVVLFGKKADGNLDIGDPSVGREAWTVDDLRVLWHGQGLRLVPRQ